MLNALINQSGASTRCQVKMTFRSQPKRPNKTGTETETETETETKTDTITDTDTRLLSNSRFVTEEQVYVVGNNVSVPSQSLVMNSWQDGKMARWQGRSLPLVSSALEGQIP